MQYEGDRNNTYNDDNTTNDIIHTWLDVVVAMSAVLPRIRSSHIGGILTEKK